jgi:AcrR family transcriptional regulator
MGPCPINVAGHGTRSHQYPVAMPRWQPNPQERLVRAALELFGEQGYEDTTVVQIAARAGLTKSTFFRHVPDKRELLFIGQELLTRAFADGIAAAPRDAAPLEAVASALDAAAVAFPAERREFGPPRRAIIAANPELQEREALKRARLTAAMANALEARGTAEAVASLAAEIGVLALGRAYARWADPDCEREFTDLARESLSELRAAGAAL